MSNAAAGGTNKGDKVIRTGDVIENPVTGERLRFLATSRDTHGEAVVVECTVEPGGFVAAAHLHPHQEGRFEVVSGEVGFKVGGKTILAGPGETLVVPAGTPPQVLEPRHLRGRRLRL